MGRDLGVIALDFNGSIVDSMPELRKLAVWTIGEHTSHAGKVRDIVGRYNQTAGEPFRKQLNTILPGFEAVRLDGMAAEYEQMKQSVVMAAEPFEDVIKSLPGLVEAGYRLAIVSSTRSRLIVGKLIDMGVWRYFDACLGEEAGSKSEKLKDLRARYFIGDTDVDRVHATFVRNCAFFGVRRDSALLFQESAFSDTFAPVTARLLELAL